jgi:hypothetical protein
MNRLVILLPGKNLRKILVAATRETNHDELRLEVLHSSEGV